MKRLVQCMLFGVVLSLGLGMIGCEKKSDVENAVDKVNEKAQDAADATKKAADDAADAVKDAIDK